MVVQVSPPPQRIVSLVPSTTESICAFGAATRLAGRTRYCTEPGSAVASVPTIGGTKNPRLDAILALDPDLVIGNAEENRAADLDYLAARVPTFVQTPRTVREAALELRALATRLETLQVAEPWLQELDERIAAVAVAARDAARHRVYYAIWRKPWMTVSEDTFVHDVLSLCGGRSVAADQQDRYPVMAPEEAVSCGVDLVLLASEPWAFDAAQRDEVVAAGCFGDATVRLCDGRDFCWHGVHMAQGLGRALAALQRCSR